MLTKPFKALRRGFQSDRTDYEEQAWIEGNMVRWYRGGLQTIGGWTHFEGSSISGICRGLWVGRDASLNLNTVYGTENGLYVIEGGSQSTITPASYSGDSQAVILGTGYGVGTYDTGNYGVDRSAYATLAGELPFCWSYDLWDNSTLLCCPTQGNIYEWGFDPTAVATTVTNAPTQNLGVMVTNEGHVMAFGAGGNLLKIQWSTQGNRTTWTPAATNSAGSLTLTVGTWIRGWLQVARGQILVWTDKALYLLTYVGYPNVYAQELLEENCGCLGQNALVPYNGRVWWMGDNAFWCWAGGQPFEVRCEIKDAIFENIHSLNKHKVVCGLNRKFGEIIWHYATTSADENDAYVSYAVDEDAWVRGADNAYARSAVTTSTELVNALGVHITDAKIYEHEMGETADGTAITTAYALTSPFEIGEGDYIMDISAIIPNTDATNGVKVSLLAKRFPEQATAKTFGPYTIAAGTERKTVTGPSGRQVQVKIESHASGGFFRIGQFRFDAQKGGER